MRLGPPPDDLPPVPPAVDAINRPPQQTDPDVVTQAVAAAYALVRPPDQPDPVRINGRKIAELEALLAPTSSYMTQDTRSLPTDGTTPAIPLDVLDADASATEYMAYRGRMSKEYAGNGVYVNGMLRFSSQAGDATKGARMEAAFFRLRSVDVDTAKTYDFNGVEVLSNTTCGQETEFDVTFDDGTDMDSVAAGDEFILLLRRKVDHADDDATGDTELTSVEVRER